MTTGSYTDVEQDKTPTLMAKDYKDSPCISEDPYFIVHRLTPVECARLQGFPDWWCDGLAVDEPTDEDIAFWREIFETYRKAIGSKARPKTDSQITKWLKNPYSDSAAYRLWGNGVAFPNVCFSLAGIVYYTQNPPQ